VADWVWVSEEVPEATVLRLLSTRGLLNLATTARLERIALFRTRRGKFHDAGLANAGGARVNPVSTVSTLST
jgi:hypothetical protein